MHSLEVFDEILFRSLRPWKVDMGNERVWGYKFSELKKSKYLFQPQFKVRLAGNLNNYRKYYSLLIENETID